ncbi:MAG TPA: DUF488 domain-containing protein [Burkholderiales bacterium]
MLKVKRAYDPPAKSDGRRILVDGLWPRGVSKAKLRLDDWAKEVAPSPALRRWFGHDPAKWDEFRRRYARELDARPEAWRPIRAAARKGTVTLVFGAHDTEHNNAVALKEYLARR